MSDNQPALCCHCIPFRMGMIVLVFVWVFGLINLYTDLQSKKELAADYPTPDNEFLYRKAQMQLIKIFPYTIGSILVMRWLAAGDRYDTRRGLIRAIQMNILNLCMQLVMERLILAYT